MGPVNKKVLAAFGVEFPSSEEENRFIREANERFMVQVGTEISKMVPPERIKEYLELNGGDVSRCALWLRQNASLEQASRLPFGYRGGKADIVKAAQSLWMEKNCPDYQQIICRVWQSFCETLRQVSSGAEQATADTGPT